MRTLITGSEGFIGRHLAAELENSGCEVIRCDINASEGCTALDIMSAESVAEVLRGTRPDVLINLAAQADVGRSWAQPQLTVQLNTVGFINILEAVRAVDKDIRVIAMGSSDEYGRLGQNGENVSEDTPLSPMTPYAVSKQAQEQFAELYSRSYGLDICCVRQFNLAGAGQARGFMISDFAYEIASVEAGSKGYISVGNLASARDFTHVRDACRAIRLIAERGRSGEVYNICSGTTYTAQEILDRMCAQASVGIEVRQDASRMRPSDTPVIRGSHDKLTSHTGWQPELGIDDIIRDALGHWRAALKA